MVGQRQEGGCSSVAGLQSRQPTSFLLTPPTHPPTHLSKAAASQAPVAAIWPLGNLDVCRRAGRRAGAQVGADSWGHSNACYQRQAGRQAGKHAGCGCTDCTCMHWRQETAGGGSTVTGMCSSVQMQQPGPPAGLISQSLKGSRSPKAAMSSPDVSSSQQPAGSAQGDPLGAW